MIDPYTTLGIEKDAGDEEVRNAYVNLVKKWDPDRFPKQFRDIFNAYEKINTKQKRVAYLLFNGTCDSDSPFSILRDHVSWVNERKPLSFKLMKEFLQKCTMR